MMKHQNIIVFILAIALLVSGAQGVSHAQNLAANQIYAEAMHSVVWINNTTDASQGSGVLIDKDKRFVVTNEHVTESAKWVEVYFPVPDLDGILIQSRDYYETNYEFLERLGYATSGRVIAKDSIRDLAIVELTWLPATAREIPHNFNPLLPLTPNIGGTVHILGNPGVLDLWRWTPGLYQGLDADELFINANVLGGHSGGPVLNAQGVLIGIITSSDDTVNAWAVRAEHIQTLLNTVQPMHALRIANNVGFTVTYEMKWSAADTWQQSTLRSGESYYHWWRGAQVPFGFPQIRFDDTVGDGIITNIDYSLDTLPGYFGSNFRVHLTEGDAHPYHFEYDAFTGALDLYDDHVELPEDVNRDGVVNMQDLTFLWRVLLNMADVNGDGLVTNADTLLVQAANVNGDEAIDIDDLLQVASWLGAEELSAPSSHLREPVAFTAADVQEWILQAKQFGTREPVYEKGIRALEQLLTTLQQVEAKPKETALLRNYPNPFNPETWVPYQLAAAADVTLTIYAVDGTLVRTLALGHRPAGLYQSKSRAAYWDGRNEFGEPVASGIYFYTLAAGDFSATGKMLVRK